MASHSPRARSRQRPSSRQVGAGSLQIHFCTRSVRSLPGAQLWICQKLRTIATLAGVSRGQISIAVVGDREMARLHREHLSVPGTTDVLTFDYSDDVEPPSKGRKTPRSLEVDGELVLCQDEARRQAKVHGHPIRLELLLYAVHGLLHLLGHDDHDPAEAAAMHAREDELLQAAGLPAAFASKASKRPARRSASRGRS